ncbi:MAG: Zn-dependent hydrolase [Candidatus Binatia bacterium]
MQEQAAAKVRNALAGITSERLEQIIQSINSYGRTPSGGVWRPGYSDLEAQARDRIIEKIQSLGLTVERDPALNVFAWMGDRTKGSGVLTGSHLDSVPNGGFYDGVLGVACGLEAVRVLRELDIAFEFPVGLTVWAAEESSCFGVGCIGSRLTTGQLTSADLLRIRDSDGVTADEAIRKLGGVPERSERKGELAHLIQAFIEVHIDQGAQLADARLPIGVVTLIISPAKIRVTFHGEAGHVGATPPSRRRDALRGAGAFIQTLYQIADEFPEDRVRLTAGAIHVKPNVVNVVPASAEVRMDLRCALDKERDFLLEKIAEGARQSAHRHGLKKKVEILTKGKAFPCPEWLVELIEASAAECEVPICRMVSFAGHDARVVGDVAPAGMILVANPAGVSHCPAEAADLDAAAAASRVLARSMLQLAKAGTRIGHGR